LHIHEPRKITAGLKTIRLTNYCGALQSKLAACASFERPVLHIRQNRPADRPDYRKSAGYSGNTV
jgi:hypothetical protein